MGQSVGFKMVFEGLMYLGPAGSTSHTGTGVVEVVNRTGTHASPAFEEKDATMIRNRGVQSFVQGLKTFEASFTLFNLTDITTTTTEGQTTVTEARADDVKIMLDAIETRNKALTAFFLPFNTALKGLYGDMLLFAAPGNTEQGDIQSWEVTLKPFAGGTGIHTYVPAT
jgi:hypothetical protein